MSREAILEVFGEYPYVTYYTVRLVSDDNPPHSLNETEKFIDVYGNSEHQYYPEFDVILRVIDAIGEGMENGAEGFLFRFEDQANALPPSNKNSQKSLSIQILPDSQLRLYCIRMTNQVVILLNGGVKTTDKALECPNVKSHFRLAQKIAKVITEMIASGEIKIYGHDIINVLSEGENIVLDL